MNMKKQTIKQLLKPTKQLSCQQPNQQLKFHCFGDDLYIFDYWNQLIQIPEREALALKAIQTLIDRNRTKLTTELAESLLWECYNANLLWLLETTELTESATESIVKRPQIAVCRRCKCHLNEEFESAYCYRCEETIENLNILREEKLRQDEDLEMYYANIHRKKEVD